MLSLVGAIELARRSPSATTIVVAHALSFVTWVVPLVAEIFSIESDLVWKLIEYASVATDVFLIIAWALPAGSIAWRLIGAALGIASLVPMALRGEIILDSLHDPATAVRLYSVAVAVSIAIVRLVVAMGIPFVRAYTPAPSRPGAYVAMAAIVGSLGVAICVASAWMFDESLLWLAPTGSFVGSLTLTLFGAFVASLRDHRGNTPWLFATTGMVAASASWLSSMAGALDITRRARMHEWLGSSVVLSMVAIAATLVLGTIVMLRLALARRERVGETIAAVVVVAVAGVASCAIGGRAWLAAIVVAVGVSALSIFHARRGVDASLPVAKLR